MRTLKLAIAIFFAACLGIIAYRVHDYQSGDRKLQALLNGDARVDLSSLTTEYQQRRLQCTDPEVLAYLKQAMMKHPTVTSDFGITYYPYQAHFKFKGGGICDVTMSVSTNGFDLFLGKPSKTGLVSGCPVPLISPVPDKVKLVLDFLNEPVQQAAGAVLILQPGHPPRRAHDESLVLQ